MCVNLFALIFWLLTREDDLIDFSNSPQDFWCLHSNMGFSLILEKKKKDYLAKQGYLEKKTEYS